MKTPNPKKLTMLTAIYDVKSNLDDYYRFNIKSMAYLDVGWFCVYFGHDLEQNEILFVVTGNNNFLLSSAPSVNVQFRKTRKRTDWVFSVDGLPYDFYSGRVEMQSSLRTSGYYIRYGKDAKQRDYLYIELPNSDLSLLFRNPASESTVAWNPARAESVVATVADSVAAAPSNPSVTPAARVFPAANDEAFSGDAELDDLLAALG